MSRSFQQIIGSEAFKKRKEEIAEAIVAGYAIDKREKYRRRGGGEGEGHENATERISPSLTNSNKRRTSLYVKNAEKQVTAVIAALKTIKNTLYENLNAST